MNRFKFHFVALTCLFSAVALSQTGTPPTSNPAPTAPASAQSEKPSSAPSPAAVPAEPAKEPGSLVAETTPVITIDGVCDVSSNGTPSSAVNSGAKGSVTGASKTPTRTAAGAKARAASTSSASKTSAGGDCKTQITRADFEKLMKAVAPTAPPQARRQIATKYVQFLTEANEAVKLGIDKEPDFPEQLAIVRMQFLAQLAEQRLRTQASNVSDTDVKTYYDENPSAFQEISVTRLFVPNSPTEQKPPDAASEPKGIADNARQQLMIGGDPEKIEKSIYDQLKNTNPPPSTKFGARRRGSLPGPQEQKLFALKDGEVSEVFSDPTGYVVYRVDEKQEVPFEKVKDEVKQRIARQRITDLSQQMQSASKVEYDDAYFGPEVANPRTGSPGGAPQSSRPPVPAPGNVTPPGESNRSQTSPPPTPK